MNGTATREKLFAARHRIRNAIEPQQRHGAPIRGRAHRADLAIAGRHRRARLWDRAVVTHRHRAGACRAAMLHARHDFLADVTAFLEIDAAELVHVALVREGVAIAEIDAALGHTKRDAMGLVLAGIDEFRA
jgi:hypothetical protein